MNTLEKREAAASKGAAILDLVQRYREKVPFASLADWTVVGSVVGGRVFLGVRFFWEDLPGL